MPKPPAAQHDGHILAALREGKGWTRYALAKRAGLPVNTLARAEDVGGLNLKTARKLCHALGVSLAVFDQQ